MHRGQAQLPLEFSVAHLRRVGREPGGLVRLLDPVIEPRPAGLDAGELETLTAGLRDRRSRDLQAFDRFLIFRAIAGGFGGGGAIPVLREALVDLVERLVLARRRRGGANSAGWGGGHREPHTDEE